MINCNNSSQGEKECPYYMRTGSCKYGANCRFNHPDPTAVGGSDNASGFGNGGSAALGALQSSLTSWSSPRTLNETAPFVPMVLSPTHPQSPEWNGYQVLHILCTIVTCVLNKVSFMCHLGCQSSENAAILWSIKLIS